MHLGSIVQARTPASSLIRSACSPAHLQARQHALHHRLGILSIGGGVVDHRVQDEDLGRRNR